MSPLEILSIPFLCLGSCFCVISGLGLLRFPDFYTRSHAAGIGDTLGAGLILIGLLCLAGPTLIGVKLVFIVIFLFITSPIACHALVKAAYSRGVRADAD
jgi:multicomponent Na+:H+ antiporter subunit G